MATGWLRVVLLLLTRTTAMNERIHALECLAHREGFSPSRRTTDTWPANIATHQVLPLCLAIVT